MAKLSKTARIIQLYLEEKTYGEIAKAVKVTHGRISSTLNRARASGRIQPNYRKRPGPNNPSFKKVKKRLRFRKLSPEAQALSLQGQRKCSKCKQIKRTGSRSWIKDASSRTGWYPVCKICMKGVNKKNYKESKRKVLRGK